MNTSWADSDMGPELVQIGQLAIYEALLRPDVCMRFVEAPQAERDGYVSTVVRHACLDHLKKARRRHQCELRGLHPDVSPLGGEKATPEHELLAGETEREISQILAAGLAKMSPREREIADHWIGGGPKPAESDSRWTRYTLRGRAKKKLRRAAERRGWADAGLFDRLFKS